MSNLLSSLSKTIHASLAIAILLFCGVWISVATTQEHQIIGTIALMQPEEKRLIKGNLFGYYQILLI